MFDTTLRRGEKGRLQLVVAAMRCVWVYSVYNCIYRANGAINVP